MMIDENIFRNTFITVLLINSRRHIKRIIKLNYLFLYTPKRMQGVFSSRYGENKY